ncbi:hypothetical protein WJX72_007074 [[Myrmecia] bisecta]|uniref:Insulin-degrading enzyme n=1 Tax=[Myrmecia] bisecta TaxID=41462 RepID=A0AAW1P6W3_9CHLO
MNSVREEIVKSPQDKRQYQWLRLANHMQVLLISDPEMAAGQADENASDSEEEEDHSGSEDIGSETDEEGESGDDAMETDEEDAEEDAKKPAKHAPKHKPVKKAAAAMAVGVGSFSDPDHVQGLSHYLEHMLFMGSEKYPDENEYDSFLTNHGGASNAFTEMELTNYHFDVKPDDLYGALDRCAQFFIAPLCKADALDREVNAVDNEFTGVIQMDDCRVSQLRCHTAKEGHVFRKFSWGNRKSLCDLPKAAGVDVRDELVKYYQQQYSAERMALVVLGGQPLEELEGWVQELFAAVPSGKGARPSYASAGLPFQGGRMYILPAVKEQHEVCATFQFPCLAAAYRSKADEYLSHMIGHEGKGSLLSALKARGWALSVCAGINEGGHDRNSAVYVFDVIITLTEAGLNAGPGAGLATIGLLYEYINMLRRVGLQKWAFDEMAAISAMKFRFEEEQDACDYVTRLAADLHTYAPEHIVNGSFLYDKWDPELVQSLLDRLTPSEMRIDLQTSAFEQLKATWAGKAGSTQSVEPWFDLPYMQLDVPKELLEEWSAGTASSPDLVLPPRNQYIPSDFSLRCDDNPADGAEASTSGRETHAGAAGEAAGSMNGHSKAAPAEIAGHKRPRNGSDGTAAAVGGAPSRQKAPDPTDGRGNGSVQSAAACVTPPPRLLRDEPGLRLWHKMDCTFRMPKAAACFVLSSPLMYASPAAAALSHLLVKLLEDALCEVAYLADIAGLEYDVWLEGLPGIGIKVDGFSHKLPLLVTYIFERLVSLQVDGPTFERVKELLVRMYRNSNMRPEKHAGFMRLYGLKRVLWHADAVLPEVEALTLEQLQGFLPTVLGQLHIETLVHGNLTAAEARQLAQGVLGLLSQAQLPVAERPTDRVVALEPRSSYLIRVPAKNPEEENSVAEVYLQADSDDLALRALLDLVEQVCHEPFYDSLRTKQQLGYSVHCGVRLTHGILGFCFLVVSGVHGPAHLDARIEDFLASFPTALAALSDEEFERHRAALIAAKMQKDRSLMDETDRHWEQIASRRYNFAVREEEVEHLRGLTLRQVHDCFAKYLAPKGKARRKLAVHLMGKAHRAELAAKAAPGVKVLDSVEAVDALKQGLPLSPLLQGAVPSPLS